jgi:hypothetical protein
MNNSFSVLIYEIDSGSVLAEFSDEAGATWCEIKYELDPDTDEIEAVFNLQGFNIPLNQCMRV